VEADTGNIGGANSHEFHVLAESGEDVIAYATAGDYAANLEKAEAAPPGPRPAPGQALERRATPGMESIVDVAAFLGVTARQCAKTLVVEGTEGPVALVLRGDHELNEIKAQHVPGVAQPLRLASDAAVQSAVGCRPGSIGPIGLSIPVWVDREAAALADFVCGANADGFHYVGVNWERDAAIDPTRVVDLRNVVPGDPAPGGQGELQLLRGIEVGHIFQLGRVYSAPLAAGVLDRNGQSVIPLMGCYGIGVTRLVAAIIEQNHDAAGIVWPEPVAPFDVHIVALNYTKSDAVRAAADDLHRRLTEQGLAVLLDDRDERPGVKFADADLIGLPHRITVGDRGLKEGAVEYRRRHESESSNVALEAIVGQVAAGR
jgi:prolyl-tRNA synthetase